MSLSFCCFVVHANIFLDPLAVKVFDDVPMKSLAVVFNVADVRESFILLKCGLETFTFLDFIPEAVGYPCSLLFMVGEPVTSAVGVKFPLDVAKILHVLPKLLPTFTLILE